MQFCGVLGVLKSKISPSVATMVLPQVGIGFIIKLPFEVPWGSEIILKLKLGLCLRLYVMLNFLESPSLDILIKVMLIKQKECDIPN